MSQRNQHLTHAMLRMPATTTPKQFQTTWCFGKVWQHAGGAEDLQSATVFPESCHSATLHLQKYCFWQSCAIFRKKGHCNNLTFGAVNTLAFWTPRSGPLQFRWKLAAWTKYNFDLLGRPFWAKPVLRSFSGPRIGSVRASCFVDDFVPCWGKRGAYPLLLEPGGSWLLIIWFRLVAWLFAAKRRPHQPFAALGDGLRCFLLLRSLRVFAQVAGFHLDDCWPPLPLWTPTEFFSPDRRWIMIFQPIPLLINSRNLKRDGVRICLGKEVGRWSIEGFVTPPSFRYRVNYIGSLNCNIARSSGVARSSEGLVYT